MKKGELIMTAIGIFFVIVVVLLLVLFMLNVVNQGKAGAQQGVCVKICEKEGYTWDSNTEKICVCNINSTNKERFSI